MTPILIYALVFVAALLLVDALMQWALRKRRKAVEVNSRLKYLKAAGNQVAAYNSLLKKRGLRQKLEGMFSGQSWVSRMYLQSGIEMLPARRIAVMILLFSAAWMAVAFILRVGVFVQLFSGSAIAIATTVGVVLAQRRRRIRSFVAQLPDAIDVIVRSLKAGHPLNAAISLVAKEMSDPIGSEFGLVNDQLSFGEPLENAMLNLYERVGAEELKLLAVTVTVQRSTGGNLAEILENLATMIRDRTMLKAKIRAISAEGRMTAVVMAIFPFGLFLLIRTLVPTYFDPLIETGWAPAVVWGCLTVMGIGILILRRLVNFDF